MEGHIVKVEKKVRKGVVRNEVMQGHIVKVEKIVHYATSAMKRFSHEYRTKFYITRCENADFRTRSVRKTAFTHTE